MRLRTNSLWCCLALCGALVLGGGSIEAADPVANWPQWRGPHRDGSVAAERWPDRLDEAHLVRQWTVPLGPSYSGPIVYGERVFVTETFEKRDEIVRALDRTSGEELWRVQWEGSLQVPFFAAANGSWIRSTPACDGDSLYVAGIRDVLVCLDVENGEERWRVDLVEEFGSAFPSFGCVASPLVIGDAVYLQGGAGFVRLDKHTGEASWRVLADAGGMFGSAFSSPMPAELQGVPQILVQTRERLAGVDPVSGAELWSQKVEALRGMKILTAVVHEDGVFTSSYGGGAFRYAISQSDDEWRVEEDWTTRQEAYMSTPVVIDGHAYLHLKNQRFTCVDLSTGETKWTTTPYGKYWSLVTNGARILALDERGDLYLIEATPEEFRSLDSRSVNEVSPWAHVAVVGDEVFIRGLESVSAYSWRTGE